MSVERTVIVGASLGGVRTAQALRAEGYEGHVVLLGEEHDLPYDRPALCKGVLRGDDVTVLLTQEGADDLDVELQLGRRAASVDRAAGEVVLEDGARVVFDRLVAATGSRPRSSPWGHPSGVHLLRTRSEAESLRADLAGGGPLVVVGAGFIGAEVAASVRATGADVTLVDPLAAPLSRVLGEEMGAVFATLHRDHGVDLRCGVGVTGIEQTSTGLQVALTDGTEVSAGAVLVCVGGRPNDEWLGESELEVADGLVCDRFSRSVTDERVLAVGDVSRWWHPRHGELVRIEHWTNAVEQAAVVAHNIVHPEQLREHVPVEYVWSDQYDWRVQLVGRTKGRPARVLGDPGSGRFAAIYGESGGPVQGLLSVNWPKAMLAARRGVAQGAAVDDIAAALMTSAERSA